MYNNFNWLCLVFYPPCLLQQFLFGIRVANFWHWHKTFANCTLDGKERKFHSSRSVQLVTDLLCSGLSTDPPAASTTGLNTPNQSVPFRCDTISGDPSAMSGGATASPFYQQVASMSLCQLHHIQAARNRPRTAPAPLPPPVDLKLGLRLRLTRSSGRQCKLEL